MAINVPPAVLQDELKGYGGASGPMILHHPALALLSFPTFFLSSQLFTTFNHPSFPQIMAQTVAFDGDHVHADLSGCVTKEYYEGPIGLRVGAIFVVLATSAFARLFPIVTKRMRRLHIFP